MSQSNCQCFGLLVFSLYGQGDLVGTRLPELIEIITLGCQKSTFIGGRFVSCASAWVQDANSSDKDKPEAAQNTQKEPKLLWDKVSLLFTYNTQNEDMRCKSVYTGPNIVKAMPPKNYPTNLSDSEALIQYLDNFPKKW